MRMVRSSSGGGVYTYGIISKLFMHHLLEGGEFRQARQIKNDESPGDAGRLIL